MSITAIIQYIILLLLIALTLFNLYNFTVGKRRRKSAHTDYKRTIALLEQDALAVVKKEKLRFETQIGYINDQNQGILLTFDKEGEMVGIFLTGEHHIIRFDEFISATRHYTEEENKRITAIVVDVETTTSVLTITFGSRTYRASSYLGKFILSDSEEFASRITDHLRRRSR